MEAEQARTRSEAEHRKTAANYNSCISNMRQLEKKLKRSINKSRSVPLFPFLSPVRASLHCMWVCVFVSEKEGLHLCHLMRSRCFLRWLCSVGVYSLCESQGMWVLTEECFSSSGFLQRQLAELLLPLSELFFFFSPCRPYFEMKAKYYLQLEVCMLAGF